MIKIILVLLVFDIVVTCLLSLGSIFRKKVIIIPGAKTEQLILPDEVAKEQVISFAILYLHSLENFNPDTLDSNIEYVLSKVSPQFYPRLKEIYRKLAKEVKQSQLSSHFTIARDSVKMTRFDNVNGLYSLTMEANRTFFSGTKTIGSQKIRYKLDIVRGEVTGQNPYGLFISGQKIFEKSPAVD